MATATKRLEQKSHISTLDAAIAVYGGRAAFCRAFNITGDGLRSWHHAGVPRAQHLGLYFGLQRRGFEPTARLFGLTGWRRCPGNIDDGMRCGLHQ